MIISKICVVVKLLPSQNKYFEEIRAGYESGDKSNYSFQKSIFSQTSQEQLIQAFAFNVKAEILEEKTKPNLVREQKTLEIINCN